MNIPFPSKSDQSWQGIAHSIRRAVQPRASIHMLGDSYTIRSEARISNPDRDYAVLSALAAGKHCILDVGANLGLTALIMTRAMAADGRLTAFDASETACRIIRDNAALNGFGDRIHVVNGLIAERSGLTIEFYGEEASGGSSIIPGYLSHDLPLSKVTMALDDFVAANGLRPDLIKIDIEGAELLALRGLAETMRTARPLIFVELHSWADVRIEDSASQILAMLEPLDYVMVYLRTKTPVTDPTVLSGRGRCHVLLCPSESPFLSDGLATLDTQGL